MKNRFFFSSSFKAELLVNFSITFMIVIATFYFEHIMYFCCQSCSIFSDTFKFCTSQRCCSVFLILIIIIICSNCIYDSRAFSKLVYLFSIAKFKISGFNLRTMVSLPRLLFLALKSFLKGCYHVGM